MIVAPPASAVLSVDCSSIERAVTRLSSTSIGWLRSSVISARSSFAQELEPNIWLPMPVIGFLPPGPVRYWKACSPAWNTALPETLMQVSPARPLAESIRSAMRPPQPVRAPSTLDDCQRLAWSLWENSLGGAGTAPERYCASVIGAISVPMFSITASRPPSKTGLIADSPGASAICRPSGSATVGASAVAASASRPIASVGRIAA